MTEQTNGPLAGTRVVDLTRILAGPLCTMMLGDMGAEIIKVEPPGSGDDTRAWGPPFIEAKDGGHLGAAYFHATNRGKRSIEADFESEDGKRIVKKLAARSDVLIENFKVGGLAKFGLDYQSLAPSCPRLPCQILSRPVAERRSHSSGGPGYLLPGSRRLGGATGSDRSCVKLCFASCRPAAAGRSGQQVARTTRRKAQPWLHPRSPRRSAINSRSKPSRRMRMS